VMRSQGVTINSRIDAAAEQGDEIRVYRDGHLVLQCPTDPPKFGCTRDERGAVVNLLIPLPGDYRVMVTAAGIAGLNGTIDRDVSILEPARLVKRDEIRTVR
jgi:hypothetical protein